MGDGHDSTLPVNPSGGLLARLPVRLERWGLIRYAEALKRQRAIHARVVAGGANAFVLCEHPLVYTLGRQTRPEHMPLSAEMLRRQGADVHEADRGGSVTCHAPGQLVGYPIFRLGDFPCGRDVGRFLRDMEEVLIRVAGKFGVAATRREGMTGVWTPEGKLAAIGVRCSRWVSMHGFAFNVAPDLAAFQAIVPCGLTQPVTSLAECVTPCPTLGEVGDAVVSAWGEVFACDLVGEHDPESQRDEP